MTQYQDMSDEELQKIIDTLIGSLPLLHVEPASVVELARRFKDKVAELAKVREELRLSLLENEYLRDANTENLTQAKEEIERLKEGKQ